MMCIEVDDVSANPVRCLGLAIVFVLALPSFSGCAYDRSSTGHSPSLQSLEGDGNEGGAMRVDGGAAVTNRALEDWKIVDAAVRVKELSFCATPGSGGFQPSVAAVGDWDGGGLADLALMVRERDSGFVVVIVSSESERLLAIIRSTVGVEFRGLLRTADVLVGTPLVAISCVDEDHVAGVTVVKAPEDLVLGTLEYSTINVFPENLLGARRGSEVDACEWRFCGRELHALGRFWEGSREDIIELVVSGPLQDLLFGGQAPVNASFCSRRALTAVEGEVLRVVYRAKKGVDIDGYSSAAGRDGTLYLVHEVASDGMSTVRALSNDGVALWSKDVHRRQDGLLGSSLVTLEEPKDGVWRCYIGSPETGNGHVSSFDIVTGELLASTRVPSGWSRPYLGEDIFLVGDISGDNVDDIGCVRYSKWSAGIEEQGILVLDGLTLEVLRWWDLKHASRLWPQLVWE